MRLFPRPCPPDEALRRVRSLVDLRSLANVANCYWLGTGDYRPLLADDGRVLLDVPWTANRGGTGSDCHGLACWGYKVPRHRAGYNRGPWATVEDDQNCDSAIEDAEHGQDLWTLVTDRPQPGDILCWPTIRRGGELVRMAHTLFVEGVGRCAEWDWQNPAFELLDVIQVCGPNGRKPAAVRSTGVACRNRDRVLGGIRHEYRTRVLRSVP